VPSEKVATSTPAISSSSAAMPRLPGRSDMTIAVTAITSAVIASVSPSDSAAFGAIWRSCTSAAAWTSAPTEAQATLAMRPPRPRADSGSLRCWYVAIASQTAPMT
jgi:hypothetical protein